MEEEMPIRWNNHFQKQYLIAKEILLQYQKINSKPYLYK